jgi:hypothetical protein
MRRVATLHPQGHAAALWRALIVGVVSWSGFILTWRGALAAVRPLDRPVPMDGWDDWGGKVAPVKAFNAPRRALTSPGTCRRPLAGFDRWGRVLVWVRFDVAQGPCGGTSPRWACPSGWVGRRGRKVAPVKAFNAPRRGVTSPGTCRRAVGRGACVNRSL